jgi:hypothetical protein
MDNVDQLKSIYQAVYGDLTTPGRLASLDELAVALSKIAHKQPAWSGRYLNSIILGHKGFSVTAELAQAIQVYAARLDEAHPLQALLVEISAYSINGNVKPGSIITGISTRCSCGVLFVPHHNFQIYCCPDCPARPRRKRPAKFRGENAI